MALQQKNKSVRRGNKMFPHYCLLRPCVNVSFCQFMEFPVGWISLTTVGNAEDLPYLVLPSSNVLVGLREDELSTSCVLFGLIKKIPLTFSFRLLISSQKYEKIY